MRKIIKCPIICKNHNECMSRGILLEVSEASDPCLRFMPGRLVVVPSDCPLDKDDEGFIGDCIGIIKNCIKEVKE